MKNENRPQGAAPESNGESTTPAPETTWAEALLDAMPTPTLETRAVGALMRILPPSGCAAGSARRALLEAWEKRT